MQALAERKRAFDQTPWAMRMQPFIAVLYVLDGDNGATVEGA